VPAFHHLAGRIMASRKFGKASFIHFQDATGNSRPSSRWQHSARMPTTSSRSRHRRHRRPVGPPIKTKTGELSVYARGFELITKSFRPLPEKWHGLKDVETSTASAMWTSSSLRR
jgi:lysyl-tRNA synthetase class 2